MRLVLGTPAARYIPIRSIFYRHHQQPIAASQSSLVPRYKVSIATLSQLQLSYRSSFSTSTATLKMSATNSNNKNQLHQFLCIIPDLPNAPRLEVRPAHVDRALERAVNGDFFLMGGAYLTHHPPPPADGSPIAPKDLPFAGSAMVVMAESEEEVMRQIREDPYTKGGVWDADNVKIWPYKTVYIGPPLPADAFNKGNPGVEK